MPGGATVTVAEILELRDGGLAEEEIWSLLCQAVQTLQDLFLSGRITDGRVVPVVTPSTLGLSRKGTTVISLVAATRAHHRPYLAPEFPDRRPPPDGLDWEKMWVYSLGRTLLSALKATAQMESLMVLRFMTAKDPSVRASLMSLLNIISEHWNASLPTKPSSHLLTEMYKEVFGSPIQCLLPSEEIDSGMERAPKIEDRELRPAGRGPKAISRKNSADGRPEPRAEARRNPVQRAPSRLYGGPASGSGSARRDRRLLPSACVGPEFVVRGTEPAKVVRAGDARASRGKGVTVILLTGRRVRIVCDPRKITCGKAFEALVRAEGIEDDYLFGLASAINGDFVFVPPEMKLRGVAPAGWKDGVKEADPPDFFLYLRVKFFLPSPWRPKNGNTKHSMYLQLRRSLLEQQIKCEPEELLLLGGLALQAEFGDFYEEEHGASSYFLVEHYVPEELADARFLPEARLQEQHRSRRGLDPGAAEEIFVARAQRLPEYGSHHYAASWVRKSGSTPMWVTVNPRGVCLYEKKKNVLDRKMHEAFEWKNIQGLSCNENYFRLVPRDARGQKAASYKLRMDNKKSFFLFRLASSHHRFFLKLRIEPDPLHALAQEFGVTLKKDDGNVSRLQKKSTRTGRRNAGAEARLRRNEENASGSRENIEERQNKENENPSENRREKRSGVRMGVSVFHAAAAGGPDARERKLSLSDASWNSPEAYVIGASIGSSEGKFAFDPHESMPPGLADEWDDVSWEEERTLRKVRLRRDERGSFGLEVVEGGNGGLFVESGPRRNAEDKADSVRKGDQLMSVNGTCLLHLSYAEALSVLKSAGDDVEILVSRRCPRETPRSPLDRQPSRNVGCRTADETENPGSSVPSKTGFRHADAQTVPAPV